MPAGINSFLTDANNNIGAIAPLGNVYTNEAFPILMASYHMSVTGASGGTNLPNVPCGKVEIQNLSGNGVMWVGGVGQSAPYSGRGYELPPMGAGANLGEKTMYVNNANQISVCSLFSGQLISFMAYGNATTTVISPATQGTAPNETVPMLSGTTPVSGSVNNAFNTIVTFTFNEPMDPNNISGLYIVTSGQTSPNMLGHLGGTITYLSGSLNATFAANSGQFQLSGWYVPMADGSLDGFNGIKLNGGIAQSGGPFQIQGPPIVSGWSPISGTTGASGLQQVLVTFSQPMQSGTINISGIFLVISGTTSPHISGTVNLLSVNSGTVASYTPASGILGISGVTTSTWVIPFANTNCKDQFGNPLNALTSGAPWETFNAPSPPDTTPPTVSGTIPLSGATGVLVIPLPAIQITMSEAVNSGLVTTNTVKVHDIQISDVNVPGTVSLQSDLVTIDWKPNAPLGNLDLHRMELSGIKDLAGNFMTPFSGATFTVEPILQVSGSTPANGDSSVSISPILQLTMDRPVLSGTVNTTTCKLVDGNGNNMTVNSVSLTSDNLTVAFAPVGLGYLAPYTYEVSGIVDINNQQSMSPFSGATFNTIAPSLTQVYNVALGNTFSGPLGQGNQGTFDQAGEAIAGAGNNSPLFGKNIRQAAIYLQRVGNPIGTINIVITNPQNAIQTTLGTIPTTSVSTSTTLYTFTNLSGNISMGSNWTVFANYSQGDSCNYINIFYNNGGNYTSTEGVVHQTSQQAGYYPLNGQGGTPVADLCGTMSY